LDYYPQKHGKRRFLDAVSEMSPDGEAPPASRLVRSRLPGKRGPADDDPGNCMSFGFDHVRF